MKKIESGQVAINDIKMWQRVAHDDVQSNEVPSELLQNEFVALKNAHGIMLFSFRVPHPISYDPLNKTERQMFIPGTPLGTRNKITDLYIRNIPRIAMYTAKMRRFNPGPLPHDRFKRSNRSWSQAISNRLSLKGVWANLRAPVYAHDVKGYDCSKLLQTAKQSNISHMSFNHCDVSPWHIIQGEGQNLYLVDFKWASNKFPEHYDITHAVARLGVAYAQPDLAKKLLGEYEKYLTEKEAGSISYFKSTIQGLLAIRTIGELRDISGSHGNLEETLKAAKGETKKSLEAVFDFVKEIENKRF